MTVAARQRARKQGWAQLPSRRGIRCPSLSLPNLRAMRVRRLESAASESTGALRGARPGRPEARPLLVRRRRKRAEPWVASRVRAAGPRRRACVDLTGGEEPDEGGGSGGADRTAWQGACPVGGRFGARMPLCEPAGRRAGGRQRARTAPSRRANRLERLSGGPEHAGGRPQPRPKDGEGPRDDPPGSDPWPPAPRGRPHGTETGARRGRPSALGVRQEPLPLSWRHQTHPTPSDKKLIGHKLRACSR